MANGKTATNFQDQSSPASQALAQSLLSEAKIEEQSLRLVIDRIRGQMAVMTAGGEVELVNLQVLEYFGKTTEELQNWRQATLFIRMTFFRQSTPGNARLKLGNRLSLRIEAVEPMASAAGSTRESSVIHLPLANQADKWFLVTPIRQADKQ